MKNAKDDIAFLRNRWSWRETVIIPLLSGITFAVMQHNNPVPLGSPCRILEIDELLEENISSNCARAMGIC